MILIRPARKCVLFFLVTCLSAQLVWGQDWRELTGYNRLRNEVGQSLENGAGISVSLVEAGGANFNFMPDASNAEFAGKVISNGTGTANGTSGHATSVAQILFGSTSSIATGITNVTAYDAGDWIINRNNLGQAGSNPLANPFSVQNHSYIADGLAVPLANEALARMDYIINRDGVTSTVGMNNGASNTLPQLFGQSYNSISVGLTNGAHSNGTTTLGASGRFKPDIVAPAGVTSLATPMVGATAAVLHQKAFNMGAAGVDARQPEAMKAIIMAGATKTQFANWDQGLNGNIITRPLDETFGAGQLNVYNSYKILEGGEFDGNLTNSQGGLVALRGWDYGEALAAGNQMNWTVEVAAGQIMDEASILLTWNAQYSDANGNFTNSRTLANMRLQLWDSTTAFKGTLLATSDSGVDNVEHLYLRNLAAGRYTFGVTTDLATDFGLAWNMTITAVPEPSTMISLSVACLITAGSSGWRKLRRRRTSSLA